MIDSLEKENAINGQHFAPELKQVRGAIKLKRRRKLKCWLICWFLWHINLCGLFDVKSIFMQMDSSISNNSV